MKNCLVLVVTLFLSVPPVQAAMLTLDELDSVVTPGASFSVQLVGRGFSQATVGGGVDLFFDPAALQVTSVTFGSSAFEFVNTVQAIDNSAGKVDSILVSSLRNPPSGDFNVATIGFMATQAGFSVLDPEASTFPAPWLTPAGDDIGPTFQDGSVRVVPLPASIWMLLGGLGAIGLIRKI